jgi:hypothetical protein
VGFLKARDQHKKRRDVGEELTLHVAHAVAFTFILVSINLFSGSEHRLSLTNDRHLGQTKNLPFWCRHVENVVDNKWTLNNISKRDM